MRSKYRIVEFEGKTEEIDYSKNGKCSCLYPMHQQYHGIQKVYIPRFVVQKISYTGGFGGIMWQLSTEEIKDLKEFTNIKEARAFKRSLELKEGIVRE